jgi:hypothetical protein
MFAESSVCRSLQSDTSEDYETSSQGINASKAKVSNADQPRQHRAEKRRNYFVTIGHFACITTASCAALSSGDRVILSACPRGVWPHGR